jgi:hypothetical protein
MNPKNRPPSRTGNAPAHVGAVTAAPNEGTKLVATEGDHATDPLAAARARGRRWAVEEYENPDNLALRDARDYAARARTTCVDHIHAQNIP